MLQLDFDAHSVSEGKIRPFISKLQINYLSKHLPHNFPLNKKEKKVLQSIVLKTRKMKGIGKNGSITEDKI